VVADVEESQALKKFALKSKQQRRKNGLKNGPKVKSVQRCGVCKPEEDYFVAVV
jgi:hypothetical protein